MRVYRASSGGNLGKRPPAPQTQAAGLRAGIGRRGSGLHGREVETAGRLGASVGGDSCPCSGTQAPGSRAYAGDGAEGRSSRCSGSPGHPTRPCGRAQQPRRVTGSPGRAQRPEASGFRRADQGRGSRLQASGGTRVFQWGWYSMENSPARSEGLLSRPCLPLPRRRARLPDDRTTARRPPSVATVLPAIRTGRGPLVFHTKMPPAAAATTATSRRTARERFTRGSRPAGTPAGFPRRCRPRRSRRPGRRRSARSPFHRKAPGRWETAPRRPRLPGRGEHEDRSGTQEPPRSSTT